MAHAPPTRSAVAPGRGAWRSRPPAATTVLSLPPAPPLPPERPAPPPPRPPPACTGTGPRPSVRTGPRPAALGRAAGGAAGAGAGADAEGRAWRPVVPRPPDLPPERLVSRPEAAAPPRCCGPPAPPPPPFFPPSRLREPFCCWPPPRAGAEAAGAGGAGAAAPPLRPPAPFWPALPASAPLNSPPSRLSLPPPRPLPPPEPPLATGAPPPPDCWAFGAAAAFAEAAALVFGCGLVFAAGALALPPALPPGAPPVFGAEPFCFRPVGAVFAAGFASRLSLDAAAPPEPPVDAARWPAAGFLPRRRPCEDLCGMAPGGAPVPPLPAPSDIVAALT